MNNFVNLNKMNIDSQHMTFILAISLFTVGYLCYFFITKSSAIFSWFVKAYGEEKTKIWWVIFQKFTGFLFLGLLPAVVILSTSTIHLPDIGLSLINVLQSVYWIAGLSAVMVLINFFAARKPDNLLVYPQIRIQEWSIKILILSSLGWFVYLLGYEFLFRGVLLFLSLPLLGYWPAIFLNVSLYAFVHMPKGAKETIACIPLGFVLCVLTLETGTIWIAFFSHLALALSNEYFSIFFNKKMRVKGLKS